MTEAARARLAYQRLALPVDLGPLEPCSAARIHRLTTPLEPGRPRRHFPSTNGYIIFDRVPSDATLGCFCEELDLWLAVAPGCQDAPLIRAPLAL